MTLDSEYMKNAALAYAKDEFPVFPIHYPVQPGQCSCGDPECSRIGKHPRIKDWKKNANTDPLSINNWWGVAPSANIGIPTGSPSGLVVVDIDGPTGEESWSSLQNEHEVASITWEVATGKGRHLYFQCPASASIRNSAGRLGVGIDIRGDGGFIVAPPSLHATGRRYQWKKGLGPETPIATIPDWLLGLCESQPKPKTTGEAEEITNLSNVFKGVGHGQRDDAIHRYAWFLIAKGLSTEEINALVTEAARNCDPPFSEADALEKVRRAKEKISGPYPDRLTDMGNAGRMARLFGENIRFCHELGWLCWDGRRWSPDKTSQLQLWAKDTVRSMYAAAAALGEDDRRKLLAQHASRCEGASRIQSMLTLLPSEPGISVGHEIFDRNPMLLNCLNGTVDLTTGELLPHNKTDHITKLAPVDYDPSTECPRWEQFLSEIMEGDQELVAYTQRSLGYALTGLTKEQAWWFAYGKGSNGKGTMLEMVAEALGDYAVTTPPETFMEAQSSIRNDLARLRGARFVLAQEPKTKDRFDPGVLKTFTGEDKIAARFLHKEFFEFKPQGKLWFAANEKPVVRDTSHGFWRRVNLVPFVKIFEGEEKDLNLKEKLRAELSGIAGWLVKGCLAWRDIGLAAPDAVREAVSEYRCETDLLADFLDQCCVLGRYETVNVSDLYTIYETYCETNKIHRVMSRQRFNGDLLGRPGILKTKSGPREKRTWWWFGIGLKGKDGGAGLETCDMCQIHRGDCGTPPEKQNPALCGRYLAMYQQASMRDN